MGEGGERLPESSKRTTSVNWPKAVDRRLDELHRLAREAGEQTSRAQLLAALVAHAPLDGEGLGVLVRSYRRTDCSEFDRVTGDRTDRSALGLTGRRRDDDR